MMRAQMYKKLDVYEGDTKEDPTDLAGYTGNFIRKKIELEPITDAEFISHFVKENRMKDIQQMIRSIDRDRNGYVTQTELDDIVKEVYPELRNKDLKRIIKPFCSVSNKILVDYGRFKSFVNDLIQSITKDNNQTQIERMVAAGKSSKDINAAAGSVVQVKNLFRQRRSTDKSKLGQALAATLQLRKTRDLVVEDPLIEQKIDSILLSPKQGIDLKADKKLFSKTINKGRSTTNLSDYDHDKGLLATLKREKFSASSNMLNHQTLQPNEGYDDEAKNVATQKKFTQRA